MADGRGGIEATRFGGIPASRRSQEYATAGHLRMSALVPGRVLRCLVGLAEFGLGLERWGFSPQPSLDSQSWDLRPLSPAFDGELLHVASSGHRAPPQCDPDAYYCLAALWLECWSTFGVSWLILREGSEISILGTPSRYGRSEV